MGNFTKTDLFQSLELPINLNYPARFGFSGDMGDFDAFDHIVQNLRSQLGDLRIVLDGRVYLPSFHTLGEASDLLQHIRIQHLVVHPVGLGTLLPVVVVVHTLVDVRCAVHQLLFGHGQRMSAALAVQLPPEDIVPPVLRRIRVRRPDLLYPVEPLPTDDCFVGIGRLVLKFPGNIFPLLGLAVKRFCLQTHQGPGVYGIVQDLVHRGRTPGIEVHIPHRAVSRKTLVSVLEFIDRRGDDLTGLQFPCNGHISQAALGHGEYQCHDAGGLWVGHRGLACSHRASGSR